MRGRPALRYDQAQGGAVDLRKLIRQESPHPVANLLLDVAQPGQFGFQDRPLLGQFLHLGLSKRSVLFELGVLLRPGLLELGAYSFGLGVGLGPELVGFRVGHLDRSFGLCPARLCELVAVALRRSHDRGSLGPRLPEKLVCVACRDLEQSGGCAGAVGAGGSMLICCQRDPLQVRITV
ncbi:hypothetical protein EFL26_17200 [Nocardioides pocheonensis]|uniref:Uncharacterized protein n=1 Tax=Nocardioides pocheonensis TaxID=661485 RepID=A0A3N0GL04_9ACTN|nr:hypothetical protein EFL26_17200 [Nocardioides pocheonensis]